MKYLTKNEYEANLEIIKRSNIQKQYRENLLAEKNKFKRKKFETNKIIAIYLFVLLNAIVVYAMVSMWKFADLSYLGVLITDIGSQVVLYAIYCVKSYKAKKAEEELKFEKEKFFGDGKNAGNFVG